jgi:ABC-type iron transport system FetAB permease component
MRVRSERLSAEERRDVIVEAAVALAATMARQASPENRDALQAAVIPVLVTGWPNRIAL